MAKVIDELLIGVGIDINDKDFNKVTSSFDQIKSAALKMGTAISGGLALNNILGQMERFSVEWDELAKTTQAYEIDANFLQNLDYISESLGGTKDDAFSLLMNIRGIQQGLKVGDLGYLEDLTRVTGIDVFSIFQKGDEKEVIESLISLFSGMSKETRQASFDVMGLQTGMRNMMKSGVDAYNSMIERAEYLGNVTEENTKKAERLQQAYTDATKAFTAETQSIFGGVMDVKSEALEYSTERIIRSGEVTDSPIDRLLYLFTSIAEYPSKLIFNDKPFDRDEYIKKSLESQSKQGDQTSQFGSFDASTSSSKSSVNYNSITIQAGGMSEKQVEGVVYKVINGAATQTEQDLKVNSQ